MLKFSSETVFQLFLVNTDIILPFSEYVNALDKNPAKS